MGVWSLMCNIRDESWIRYFILFVILLDNKRWQGLPKRSDEGIILMNFLFYFCYSIYHLYEISWVFCCSFFFFIIILFGVWLPLRFDPFMLTAACHIYEHKTIYKMTFKNIFFFNMYYILELVWNYFSINCTYLPICFI